MTLSLFDLPAEVRQQIWRLVTCDAYVSIVRHLAKPRYNRSIDRCHSLDIDRDDKKRPWVFLLTCKLMWDDAHHLYLTCDTLRSTWLNLIHRPTSTFLLDHIRTIQLSDHCTDCYIGLHEGDAANHHGPMSELVGKCLLQFRNLEEVYLPMFTESDDSYGDSMTCDEVRQVASCMITDSGPWFAPGLEAYCPHVHFIFDIEGFASPDSMFLDIVSQLHHSLLRSRG